MSRPADAALAALRERADAECAGLHADGASVIRVGTATCGRSAGALEVLEAFREALAENSVEAKLFEVGCLGHCYAEPMVEIARPGWPPLLYGYVTPGRARALVRSYFLEEDPQLEWILGATEPNEMLPTVYDSPRFGREHRWLLRRCGKIDPENLWHYIADGGYDGLVRALALSPEEVVETVRRSGLRGLGGAGFPTARKWDVCRADPRMPHYLVCNGDEGDPGAFMDRTVLESDPQAVLEGMLIGAHAIGAEQGYVYVRNEYPLAVQRVGLAIEQAREAGLLGEGILGTGLNFELQVIQGAGAFVCGEESALIASIEGKRGMPQPRPPYPASRGLHGKPTVLNNVKTFANVASILREGPEAFAAVGTEKCKGSVVFALAGKIRAPGLVEIEMGTTLRELIFDIGGGVPPYVKPSETAGEPPKLYEKTFKAVQVGGPSGGCLPDAQLDTPVGFDKLKQTGAMMGSGGMVILDEDNCAVNTARFFLEFTQKESCGKCTFCRIGTRHMLDILERICRGEGEPDDLPLLEALARDVAEGSLCNLGKTAPNPILSTLKYFREEYRAHIEEKRCPSCECSELTAFYIAPEKCHKGCDACVGSCPTEAIFTRADGIKVVEQVKCVKCNSCLEACPPEYDAVIKISPPSAMPPELLDAAPPREEP